MTRGGGGDDLLSFHTSAYTCRKSTGGNSDNFCTLDTTFHGQKTFRLVRGSLSWSEPSDRDILRQSGSQIKDFYENLTVSLCLCKSHPPGVQEKRKKLEVRS